MPFPSDAACLPHPMLRRTSLPSPRTSFTHPPPYPPIHPRSLHYFEYEHRGRSFLIWGLTAGMLIVVAEKALGRRPSFQPDPPGAVPYQRLTYEGGRLVVRGPEAAEGGDALGVAAEAATGESPRSAAVEGAVVTDREAAAALGVESEEGGSGGSKKR